MKIVSLGSLSRAALLAVAFTAVAHAEKSETAAVSKQGLEAKFLYCRTCHGVEGQGFRGAFPIPRLAGQQPEYIKNQLKAFIERQRTNPVMFQVAHVLSPPMIDGLAEQFKALNPKPLGGAPENLVAAGKAIFENGVPGANVPPCASCHGPEAKGAGQFPRLAGQLNDYITNKLENWSKERATETAAIMAPVAHALTKPQIAAVAAYLSTLE